jgi:hypothetical protein
MIARVAGSGTSVAGSGALKEKLSTLASKSPSPPGSETLKNTSGLLSKNAVGSTACRYAGGPPLGQGIVDAHVSSKSRPRLL